jgi:hypothetical protein
LIIGDPLTDCYPALAFVVSRKDLELSNIKLRYGKLVKLLCGINPNTSLDKRVPVEIGTGVTINYRAAGGELRAASSKGLLARMPCRLERCDARRLH